MILPTESPIRTGFESLVARLGIAPRILADVDDMAMVRLLARENAGIAIAPSVVVQDEIALGLLAAAPFDLRIVESFYAVTVPAVFLIRCLKACCRSGRRRMAFEYFCQAELAGMKEAAAQALP